MKFYLKYINPVVAAMVLFLCIWAAISGDRDKLEFWGVFVGGFGTYFVAKGIFCSSILFFSGRTFLNNLTEKSLNEDRLGKRGISFILLCISLCVGCFISIYVIHEKQVNACGESAQTTVVNPPGLAVANLLKVPSSQFLMLTCQLKNTTTNSWESVGLNADIYIGGVFSGRIETTDTGLKSQEMRNIIFQSKDLLTSEIHDSVRLDINITGTK